MSDDLNIKEFQLDKIVFGLNRYKSIFFKGAALETFGERNNSKGKFVTRLNFYKFHLRVLTLCIGTII